MIRRAVAVLPETTSVFIIVRSKIIGIIQENVFDCFQVLISTWVTGNDGANNPFNNSNIRFHCLKKLLF